MIYRSIYFWIATVLLLLVVGFSGLKIIPPLLSSVQENREQISQLETELAKQKKFLTAVNAVKDDQDELDSVYEKAQLALPRDADSSNLMLQLDGLLNALGLATAQLSVPLESTTNTAAAETTEGTADTVAAPNQLEVTISGEFGYEKFVALLDSLKTFSRWNKISSFELTRSGDIFTARVVTKVFVKPGPIGEFSGNSTILEDAKTLFAGFSSYATTPNVTQEGTYGKENPFAP